MRRFSLLDGPYVSRSRGTRAYKEDAADLTNFPAVSFVCFWDFWMTGRARVASRRLTRTGVVLAPPTPRLAGGWRRNDVLITNQVINGAWERTATEQARRSLSHDDRHKTIVNDERQSPSLHAGALRGNCINATRAPVRGTSADAVFPALDAVRSLDGTAGRRATHGVATQVATDRRTVAHVQSAWALGLHSGVLIMRFSQNQRSTPNIRHDHTHARASWVMSRDALTKLLNAQHTCGMVKNCWNNDFIL